MKRKKPLLGVTGVFGSGKTTVSAIFGKLGAAVFSADDAARTVAEDLEVIEEIGAAFGAEVLNENGSVDRKKLADVVFKDDEKLQQLNQIIHPLVRKRMWNMVDEQLQVDKIPMIVIDAPLIYETDLHTHLDFVVVVFADVETSIERVRQRDGLRRDKIHDRLSSQMPLSEKKKRADFCIDNKGSEDSLVSQVEEVFKEIQKVGK